jgi:hypothetical protein
LPNVNAEELKILKSSRTFSRYWFACLVAPALVFSFHQIRPRSGLFEVKQSSLEQNIVNENNSTKSSNFGLFFLLKKVNVWVIVIIILILILMFFIFDGMSMIYYIKNLKNEIYYFYYFKIFLLFIILIPIIINSIILYLLKSIEKKGEISIPNFLPSILNRSINYLVKVGKNKELLSYYKERCKSELVFYVIILILYFICFMFMM